MDELCTNPSETENKGQFKNNKIGLCDAIPLLGHITILHIAISNLQYCNIAKSPWTNGVRVFVELCKSIKN